MSRLSRRGWLFGRGCLVSRGSLLTRRESSRGVSVKIFFFATGCSAAGRPIALFAGVTLIVFCPDRMQGLSAPQVFAIISLFVPPHRIVRRPGSGDQAQISG